MSYIILGREIYVYRYGNMFLLLFLNICSIYYSDPLNCHMFAVFIIYINILSNLSNLCDNIKIRLAIMIY